MSITPGTYDIVIYRGTSYNQIFVWADSARAPINLTGYSAQLEGYATADSPEPFITLSSADGTIVLGGAAGTIQLLASLSVTTALQYVQGIYALRITDTVGDVDLIMQGKMLVL